MVFIFNTTQRDFAKLKYCTKMKFSIKVFLSKCDQIRRKLQLWPHLLKKCLMQNFIFCAVKSTEPRYNYINTDFETKNFRFCNV